MSSPLTLPFSWPMVVRSTAPASVDTRQAILFCGESQDLSDAFHHTISHTYLTLTQIHQYRPSNIKVLYGAGNTVGLPVYGTPGEGSVDALKQAIVDASASTPQSILLVLSGHGSPGDPGDPVNNPPFLKCFSQSKEEDSKRRFGPTACRHLPRPDPNVKAIAPVGYRHGIDLTPKDLAAMLPDNIFIHAGVFSCYSGAFLSLCQKIFVRSFCSATDAGNETERTIDDQYWQAGLAWSTGLGMSHLQSMSWADCLYEAHRSIHGCEPNKQPLFYLRSR